MREYALDPNKIKAVMIRTLPAAIIPLAIPLFIYFMLSYQLREIEFASSGALIMICIIYFIFSLVRAGIRMLKVRRDWLSYRIIRSAGSITKKQHKMPDIEIMDEEIVRVVQITGGLSIQTITQQKFIFIPSDLENFDNLVYELNQTKIVEVSPITSIGVPPEYSLRQQVKPGSILKRLLISFSLIFGVFLLFILLVFGLIYMLAEA